jgi:hypothetical protein
VLCYPPGYYLGTPGLLCPGVGAAFTLVSGAVGLDVGGAGLASAGLGERPAACAVWFVSCSVYAVAALHQFGPLVSALLACHADQWPTALA